MADGRPAASPESVRPDADEQADCARKKGLQIQAFLRAAEGIRTLDLLHGKKNAGEGVASKLPANTGFFPACDVSGCAGFDAELRGFED
jgi:hypothetical protein